MKLFLAILFTSIVVGVLAGFYLTTLMLVIICLVLFSIWLALTNGVRTSEDAWVIFTLSSLVFVVSVWITCFVATNPNWSWIGTFLHEAILR